MFAIHTHKKNKVILETLHNDHDREDDSNPHLNQGSLGSSQMRSIIYRCSFIVVKLTFTD